MPDKAPDHWDDPATVAKFAAREPDHRLRTMLDALADPHALRVLDLGCAGGRNAVLLAERGCDVHAVDLAPAMVAETRRRLAAILGNDAARDRVREARMNDLSFYDGESFDLVVALGILHQAGSVDEWQRAVAECARILRAGGQLLIAHFAPGTDLTGHDGRRVEGELDLWEIAPGHFAILFNATTLDARMQKHGFTPLVRTETVRNPSDEGGMRVTVNGLYEKG